MSEYGTVGGVPVGDEDIEAMVANAEAGFPDVTMSRTHPGRPSMGDGPARTCLLYTSPSPRDQRGSRMPSSA